jgi:hypothetical protein
MPQFTDPSIAERWAREVNTAAADWAKFEGRNQESKTELDKATMAQQRAQADSTSAQSIVDRGRSMKRDAERLSSGSPIVPDRPMTATAPSPAPTAPPAPAPAPTQVVITP